jgi:hypothetical protein
MPKIEIEIGGDNSDLQRKIAEAEILLKRLRKDVAVELKAGNIDLAEKMTVEVNKAKESLKGLQAQYTNTTKSTNVLSKSTANGSNALMQFSRIAQDAPFGIMGIGNNITATAESFSYLSKSAGGTGNALKAVASSMMGTGGILLAVSLVTSALTYMSQNGITMGDVFDRLSGKAKDFAEININKAFELDEVVKATQNIQSLTTQVQLAKDGFIDKKDVVEEYNKTVGRTMGVVKDLDGVEQMLVKNGAAYIQMTLLKAAANMAAEDAAKQTLEAEKSRQKKLNEFNNAFLDADLTQTRSKEQYDAKQANLQQQLINRKKEEVKINQDAANANLRIANKFNADAAAIAKKYNFSFGGNNKPDPIKTISAPKIQGLESSLMAVDPEKMKTEGKKVIKLLEDSLGSALNDFKNKPIDLQIPLNPIIPPDILTLAEQQLIDFNDAASDIISNNIADTFGNLASVIGGAIANGGNVLQAAGSALLAGLGSVMVDLGKMAIATGVGILGVKLALKSLNPAVAIAGGVALVALGSVFASKAGGLSNSMGSGGGSGNSGSSGALTNSGGNSFRGSQSSGFGGNSTSGGFGSVVFEISGQSLIGVLGNALDKNKRLGGNLQVG